MDYTLTDKDRQMLTESLLGECWHKQGLTGRGCCCDKGAYSVKELHTNRSFDTPQDRHDLAVALGKKGLWEKFYKHSQLQWVQEFSLNYPLLEAYHTRPSHSFSYWILVEEPERFCKLCATFMKGRDEQSCLF